MSSYMWLRGHHFLFIPRDHSKKTERQADYVSPKVTTEGVFYKLIH